MKKPIVYFSYLLSVFCCCLLFADTYAQELSKKEMVFLEKNAVPVPQWSLLKKELKGKKMVLLGEFTHGAKEVFELKNDLIAYLHRELDYDVILFESGLGELIAINENKDSLAARNMTLGLIGPWRTREFEDLMEWVKNEKVEIAGFDVQRSGHTFQGVIEEAGADLGWNVEDLIQLELRYTIVARRLRNENSEEVLALADSLITAYDRLINRLPQETPATSLHAFFGKTLANRKEFLKYFLQFAKGRDYRRRWEARDSLMADNIRWLMSNVYKNKKVIILAHNFHIAKYNEKEEVMGEMLARDFGDQMYSIGIFAGGGVYANNSRKEEPMDEPDPDRLDLKHIVRSLSGGAHFLSIPDRRQAGDEWLYRKIIVNDTFIDLNGSNEMELARSFDGLLFLEKVSMPEFFN